MVANKDPIFSKTPVIGFAQTITAANTARDGTGTTTLVFTAGAEGAFVNKINVVPLGTNVASVLRAFLNNGSTPGTAVNNALIKEMALPATTASEITGQSYLSMPIDMAIPAGYRIYVTIGTAIAAGISVVCSGGDY